MKIFRLFSLFIPFFAFGQQADCLVYFSPSDRPAEKLIQLISKEEVSIKLAAYSITHAGIAKALMTAKERGVAIEILVDPFAVKARSSTHKLVGRGVPLFVWDQNLRYNPTKRRARMHEKFCIFGSHTVWTGSFNFTNDSNLRHRENAIVMRGHEIAGKYLTHFSHMKLYESRPYGEYLALYPKRKKNSQKSKVKLDVVEFLSTKKSS